MKILFVGGGSGGTVVPLLAVAEEIKKHNKKAVFLFIGTKKGPEAILVKKAGFDFVPLPSGKWRRYFSIRNIFAPFFVLAGFVRALRILKRFKPDVVFGTGSFVQVPVIWAAWFLKIPSVIHQQDFAPSLANSLCQLAANEVTVTFEKSLKDFSSNTGLFYGKNQGKKITHTGNPFRESMKKTAREKGVAHFKLKKDFPTLLVLGGGTGAKFLNEIIYQSAGELTRTVQIIHICGKSKFKNLSIENYSQLEFTTHMAEAYAAADFVLSRAGLSTITELANLKKVSIVVPMPNSHQEANGLFLFGKKAAIVIPQQSLEPQGLIALIRKLLFEPQIQARIKSNISRIIPKDSTQKIANIIIGNAKRK